MKSAPDDLGLRSTSTAGLGLFDAVSARTTPSATRKAAQEKAEREGQKNRRLLLAAITAHGPMTADEAAAAVGLTPLQARPRVCQLAQAGDLIDTSEKRPSSQGNPMTVWRAT